MMAFVLFERFGKKWPFAENIPSNHLHPFGILQFVTHVIIVTAQMPLFQALM